ncbi:hypothetical protein NE237_011082 [Protea cynaroides]|uniref:BHLH domain-containing protein n=1 Tax=Protea cynaroides TaxID=273540 RepID=A0A9Q0GVD8_9MAGN|nr:hypothetical protein NE237_011082 [Protea cynaroides]
MEEEREQQGVTLRSCSNAVNPPMASKDIIINDEKASSSKARKRTRDEASGKMRVEIQKERGRRDKKNELYSTLRSMVPHLVPKATRERIVNETITYIGKLEQDLKKLQEQKADAEAESIYLRTHQNSSMEVTVSSNVALFGIGVMTKRPTAVMEKTFRVFEEHKAEVLAANIAVKDWMLTLTITALMKGDGDDEITVERIKVDLTHALNLLPS